MGGACAAGGVGEGGNGEVDGLAAAGGDLAHLGELGLGAGEADLQAFGLAEPALGFGLGDAGDEVVADLDQAGSGGGVGAQQRAAQAALTEMILSGLARRGGVRNSRNVTRKILYCRVLGRVARGRRLGCSVWARPAG